MLVKEYLSMAETVNFVFELTGEKINWSTLEELSNIDKLTPVFLFSGYVGYPVDEVIVYDKMKAYFTHDDFFMHQTRNYQDYSMFSDADVPEWIEIHSPFKIQHIIKKQTEAYSVFDEVFLFKSPPIGELDKLDDLEYSHIDFDEVRFSKNELLGLFGNVNKLGESQKKADDKSKLASKELGRYQKLLTTYELFTPEKIACLLTDSNPAYNHNNDDYNARLDMVSNAIDAGKLTYINSKDEISVEQIKIWLRNNKIIFDCSNDNLSLEQSMQVTKLQKRIDELEKELNVFKEGSNDLSEVIKINFTDDEYRDIVELANQEGVSESEYVSNAVMKAIDTIYPFIKAFNLNDDENLSKARSKFLNYLKENENSFEVFSMLADAEIFPHEYSQFSTNQESNIKDSAYFLIAVMKDLLLNVEITGYYFQSDSDNGKKSPTQAALTEHINSMSIKNLSTRNINGIFSDANRLLKDAIKE